MKQITFKQKVVQGIYDLFYVWKQELRNLFRDQGVLIFFVLVPLTYPLIYSFIYTNETVREVPAVVVDNSRSSLSREYLRKVDASPETSIVAHCADMEEARLMLKERKAYGIIYIPSGFSDDIVRGMIKGGGYLLSRTALLQGIAHCQHQRVARHECGY